MKEGRNLVQEGGREEGWQLCKEGGNSAPREGGRAGGSCSGRREFCWEGGRQDGAGRGGADQGDQGSLLPR